MKSRLSAVYGININISINTNMTVTTLPTPDLPPAISRR